MNERDIISNKRNKKNYQQQVMYNQTFCIFAALNQSGILLDYYLVYFCVIIYSSKGNFVDWLLREVEENDYC